MDVCLRLFVYAVKKWLCRRADAPLPVYTCLLLTSDTQFTSIEDFEGNPISNTTRSGAALLISGTIEKGWLQGQTAGFTTL
ncbi:hypothetical protein [Chitinophaga sp. HK235]|uniref:hypothetical protein n=1 Tax=Chitinophaga sp. HK235 TaxID=2952571 RepID=UPI001BAA8407|nr:hypothetical protein [Chitinophaga sp. HK235]